MKKIWVVCTVVAFAFTIHTSGQTTSTYNTGIGHATPLIPTAQSPLPNSLPAIAITYDYYAQPKTLVVHALNNSGKDITGYTIIIRHKNPDGTLDKGGWTQSGSDLLFALVAIQMAKDPEERKMQERNLFVAGTTRDMTLNEVDSGSEMDITYGVVFYADTTFDEQNADAFKRMLANRQKELLVMKKTDEAIENVLADQSNDHPAAAAIADLTKAAIEAATHKPDGPYDPEQNLQWPLQNSIQSLSSMQGQQKGKTERERLTQYVEDQEKRIELMTPHCHLEITPSQYVK